MAKKKFTQGITDILADEMAMLEAIEPGALVRPLPKPTPPVPEPSLSEPPVAQVAVPEVVVPEVVSPVTVSEVVAAPQEVFALKPLEAVAAPAVRPEPEPETVATEPEAITLEPEATGVVQPSLLPDLPEAPPAPAAPDPVSEVVAPPKTETARIPERHPRVFSDSVTLLEIAPPEAGGTRESALPGDRSQSPPPPDAARRIGWHNPVLSWTAFVLGVLALASVFLTIAILVFHLS
jgi:hypothetical protein